MSDPVMILDASGSGDAPVVRPPTPEEEAQKAADQAKGATRRLAQSQASADDTERMRTINERARTDPAYAALADIVLRGLSR